MWSWSEHGSCKRSDWLVGCCYFASSLLQLNQTSRCGWSWALSLKLFGGPCQALCTDVWHLAHLRAQRIEGVCKPFAGCCQIASWMWAPAFHWTFQFCTIMYHEVYCCTGQWPFLPRFPVLSLWCRRFQWELLFGSALETGIMMLSGCCKGGSSVLQTEQVHTSVLPIYSFLGCHKAVVHQYTHSLQSLAGSWLP